jgi:hypothetical protein
MRARRTHARTCCVRALARVRVCELAPTHPRRRMRAPSAGVDRGWFGTQAFASASAFNANLGAWNTAAVLNMAYVCAALSAREYAACARVRRALFVTPSIDGTRTYTVYVYTLHARVHIHARLATPMNGSADAGPPHTRAHVLRPCARVCVCDWARARVRVRFGAHASAPTHASALPSASNAGGFGSQAFQAASAFNANIGAWNTASVSNLSYVCAAFPAQAARATAAERARPGRRCGADRCARRRRRCARARVRRRVGRRMRGCARS